MTDFKGHCHCKQTEWTATLEKDQQAHILWTGLLDDGIKNFQPGAEIFGKDRLGWEKEVAQTFEVMPPS
ncbi:hypothetical protein IG631_18831 [Alternaria alternata]|nr:hypothetical protein IG631_18831 [Alternaria alternata]